MRSLVSSIQGCLSLAVGLSILLSGLRADASERVVLKYRILQTSVSVPELAKFAKTGEASGVLWYYLKKTGTATQDVRRPLNEEIKVNPFLLYQVLNTPVGEVLLDQISQVIHTPDNLANRQSLRSALVSSALPDGKITLIETLQNYPTQQVHVEGDRLVEVYNQLNQLARRLPRF
ncbi:MAG: alpha/beta hydrolase [Crinalium sp.]